MTLKTGLIAGLSFAISTLFTLGTAQAQETNVYTSKGVYAPDVVTILQDEGYRAKLDRDEYDEPMIETTMSGLVSVIFFYNCVDDYCEDMQFACSWGLDEPLDPDVIERWNEGHRFGRAYLDEEGDPIVEIDLQLGPGGTPELIAGYVYTAEVIFSAFEDFISTED